MDEVHVFLANYIPGRIIETGVIGPLVEDLAILLFHLIGDGVLTDDGALTLQKQLVDTVVDLTVQVVGPACKDNDGPPLAPSFCHDNLALGTNSL